MPIRVTCASCGASLKGGDEVAGKKVKCPRCGSVMTAPLPSTNSEIPVLTEVPPIGPQTGDSVFPISPKDQPAEPNVPAILSIPLALIAWPIVGVFFFLVFKQLLQSLLVGIIVAVMAVGCAVWGFVLAMNTQKKVGGTGASIAGLVMGGLSLILLVGSSIAATMVAKQVPESFPAANVIQQVIGTEAPADLAMRCSSCQHEFEVLMTDYAQHQARGAARVFEGAANIDDILDNVEEQGAMGYPCPQCSNETGRLLMNYPSCGERFMPDASAPLAGGASTCPQCGTRVQSPAGSLLRLDVDGE